MPKIPTTQEEVRARVAEALRKFENQPKWRQRKAAMTDSDFRLKYQKEEIRKALKSA